MSWVHIRAVRDNPPADLKPAAASVLLAIAAYANPAGEAWPTIGRLSKLTGFHPSSVRRSIDQLAAAKVLTVTARRGLPSLIHLADPAPTARTTPRPTPRPERANPAPAEHEEVVYEVESRKAHACEGERFTGAEPPFAPLPDWLADRLASRPSGIQLTMEV